MSPTAISGGIVPLDSSGSPHGLMSVVRTQKFLEAPLSDIMMCAHPDQPCQDKIITA